MNCEAKDIIYALQCGGCEKQYIGETGDLRARVRLHEQHIFNPRYRTLYVSHNIARCTTGKATGHFRIVPILLLNRNDRLYREEMELSLIYKYKPELNSETRQYHQD